MKDEYFPKAVTGSESGRMPISDKQAKEMLDIAKQHASMVSEANRSIISASIADGMVTADDVTAEIDKYGSLLNYLRLDEIEYSHILWNFITASFAAGVKIIVVGDGSIVLARLLAMEHDAQRGVKNKAKYWSSRLSLTQLKDAVTVSPYEAAFIPIDCVTCNEFNHWVSNYSNSYPVQEASAMASALQAVAVIVESKRIKGDYHINAINIWQRSPANPMSWELGCEYVHEEGYMGCYVRRNEISPIQDCVPKHDESSTQSYNVSDIVREIENIGRDRNER